MNVEISGSYNSLQEKKDCGYPYYYNMVRTISSLPFLHLLHRVLQHTATLKRKSFFLCKPSLLSAVDLPLFCPSRNKASFLQICIADRTGQW